MKLTVYGVYEYIKKNNLKIITLRDKLTNTNKFMPVAMIKEPRPIYQLM